MDPDLIHTAREFFLDALAEEQGAHWRRLSVRPEGEYRFTAEDVACRKMASLATGFLARLEGGDAVVEAAYNAATNMTDRMAGLVLAANRNGMVRERVLADFERRYLDDALVMDKWFAVQAMAKRDETLEDVVRLMAHSAFSMENPNKVRSLVGAFASGNPRAFHDKSGAGYRFLADRVLELNGFNPQIGARMVSFFNDWKRFEDGRKALMKAELSRILAAPGLSRDIYEIASRALA